MDVRQITHVLAVVDHGGFTRAAASLHLAQPSLSQSVKRLENELGVELFARAGRGVTLTAAGEAFVGPARQVVRDLDAVRRAVGAVAAAEAGHLDLVCLPTLAVWPVAEHVGRFRRAHPDVTVRLVEPDEPAAVARMVESGHAEIGYTELPVDHRGVGVFELTEQDFVAVVPASWNLPDTMRIEDLAPLALVTTSVGTSTRRLVDEAFSASGRVPKVAIETDHREVVTAMVRSGAGYSLLPRQVAANIARRDARTIEIEPHIRRRVGLIHRSAAASPAAAAFLAMVRQELASHS